MKASKVLWCILAAYILIPGFIGLNISSHEDFWKIYLLFGFCLICGILFIIFGRKARAQGSSTLGNVFAGLGLLIVLTSMIATIFMATLPSA